MVLWQFCKICGSFFIHAFQDSEAVLNDGMLRSPYPERYTLTPLKNPSKEPLKERLLSRAPRDGSQGAACAEEYGSHREVLQGALNIGPRLQVPYTIERTLRRHSEFWQTGYKPKP